MPSFKMFSMFGICVGSFACTLTAGGVAAQSTGVAFDKNLIGGFIRTAAVEPLIFGKSECANTDLGFCSGSAVAAVALEFPDKGSLMVRDLASNLVESAPFLRARVKVELQINYNNQTASNVWVNLPNQEENQIYTGIQTAASSVKEAAGFDLVIPVNVLGNASVQPAMTAGLRKNQLAPKFTFQKSYAFLK